uniref:Uncharacterized protein n=1 Tax=Oryza glumipatula TaxID=40148 RepID=A0A0D9ZA40_9ORYZ
MAARGQKAVAALPHLVKSLRSEPVSNAPRLRHLPSLRRTFSLYDQINLIDSVPEDQLRFQSYDDTGFNINKVKHIQPISPELHKFIQSTGMKLEAVDSRNAASTYNILNEEGRPVAAALLPCGVTS